VPSTTNNIDSPSNFAILHRYESINHVSFPSSKEHYLEAYWILNFQDITSQLFLVLINRILALNSHTCFRSTFFSFMALVYLVFQRSCAYISGDSYAKWGLSPGQKEKQNISSFRSTPTVQLIVFGSILMYSLNATPVLAYLHFSSNTGTTLHHCPCFFFLRTDKKRTVRYFRKQGVPLPYDPEEQQYAVRRYGRSMELVLHCLRRLGPTSQKSWCGQRTVPSPRSWRGSGATPTPVIPYGRLQRLQPQAGRPTRALRPVRAPPNGEASRKASRSRRGACRSGWRSDDAGIFLAPSARSHDFCSNDCGAQRGASSDFGQDAGPRGLHPQLAFHETGLRPCLLQFFFCKISPTFICIWQILSNHILTKLKRFVS
jgi:hypothetical protein